MNVNSEGVKFLFALLTSIHLCVLVQHNMQHAWILFYELHHSVILFAQDREAWLYRKYKNCQITRLFFFSTRKTCHKPDFGYVTATVSSSLKVNSCENFKLSRQWVSSGSTSSQNSSENSSEDILSESHGKRCLYWQELVAMENATNTTYRHTNRGDTKKSSTNVPLFCIAPPPQISGMAEGLCLPRLWQILSIASADKVWD